MSILRTWFANPWSLGWLALLPALGILALLALGQRRRALAKFGLLVTMHSLTARRRGLRFLQPLARTTALLLLVVGSAGPQWSRDWEQPAAPGRDLAVVLDLSRSMLAQDVLPNRAEKAKQALLELSDSLQQRGGHRVALVAFAGRARIVCPLTHDYDHFRTALVDLDANTLPADLRASGEAPTSGTRIGAALHAAILAHDPGMDGHQDILLLSDGDDPAQDGEWQQGALEARSRRIPVHTVGIGDPKLGSPIPNKDGKPLKYQNEMVMTRLEEQPLAEIARLTNGTFTPARTDSLPLAELFHQRMEPRGVKNQSEDAMPLYRQQYGWFFAPALFLLGAEMLIGRGVQRQRRRSEEHL